MKKRIAQAWLLAMAAMSVVILCVLGYELVRECFNGNVGARYFAGLMVILGALVFTMFCLEEVYG